MPDAEANCRIMAFLCSRFSQKEYTVIIDAVFGVGLSRAIEGRYHTVIEWMNDKKVKKQRSTFHPAYVRRAAEFWELHFSDITVSMEVKLMRIISGETVCRGNSISSGRGIDFFFFEKNKDVCITYDPEALLLPKRAADSHKGDYGKILMITGSKGMAGAAYLSAKAAYAVGAGLVQIYTAEENRTVLQELLPEAIISCYNETAGKPDDKELEKLIQWADVICIGCGLGTSVFASRLLKKTMEILRENGSEEEKLRSCPCIIDADGLNLLSMDMEQLQGVPNVILTPHMKEMSRLINKEIPQIAERRFSVVKEFTEQYQVVCALKKTAELSL